MRKLTTTILFLFAVLCYGQSEANKDITINAAQPDDAYYAGETITINAPIVGDLVVAGGKLIVNDSIHGDLTGAGGEITIGGNINDDVRVAGGRITIDSEIGDDLVVFGGEIIITKNARINGKLKCRGGTVTIDGEVMEQLDASGGEVTINGTIYGASKLFADDITIGETAKFHGDVEYWQSDGEINFNNAMVNANASYSEQLGEEQSDLSMTTYGTNSIKKWIYYILSSFLIILVMHALFRQAFSHATEGLEDNLLKSFGIGLIYLIGIPVAILATILILIGIPIGLFAAVIFIFSLLFGHLIAAILIAYYLQDRNQKTWSFWKITFIALACAIVLRLFTMIPYVGILISIVILSVTYGALTLKVLRSKKEILTQ